MITEKQKEAVKELCQYVDNFCKENNLSAFMSVAASEDQPDGLEQIAGSIITGKLHRKVVQRHTGTAAEGAYQADGKTLAVTPAPGNDGTL